MNFDEFDAAVTDARQTLIYADRTVKRLAGMMTGRLRTVDSTHILRQLKRELRDFDAVTGLWKEEK